MLMAENPSTGPMPLADDTVFVAICSFVDDPDVRRVGHFA
jgi:hypothetical protein